MGPQIGILKSIVAELGISGPRGVDLICSKVRLTSALVSEHYFIVHLTNFMHGSTCPLLWGWCNDDTVGSVFCFQQKSLNLSETKVIPLSYIILS